jgi:hypothetical protein
MNAQCSPERLETRKHAHPTAQTRPRSHTEHIFADRRIHPHNHGNIAKETQGRLSHSDGSGAAALVMVPLAASELHHVCA